MPLVGGFSLGSPVSLAPFIPAPLHIHFNHSHWLSRPRLRAPQRPSYRTPAKHAEKRLVESRYPELLLDTTPVVIPLNGNVKCTLANPGLVRATLQERGVVEVRLSNSRPTVDVDARRRFSPGRRSADPDSYPCGYHPRQETCLHYTISTTQHQEDPEKLRSIQSEPLVAVLPRQVPPAAVKLGHAGRLVSARLGEVTSLRIQLPSDQQKTAMKSYRAMGCSMYLKLHFLDSYTESSPDNLVDVSDENVERFHQPISTKEKRRQDKWSPTVRQLASYQGEPGSIPVRVTPEFSQVGVVSDDAAGLRVFSGISRFPRPGIPMLLHITSFVRAADKSPLNYRNSLTEVRTLHAGAISEIKVRIGIRRSDKGRKKNPPVRSTEARKPKTAGSEEGTNIKRRRQRWKGSGSNGSGVDGTAAVMGLPLEGVCGGEEVIIYESLDKGWLACSPPTGFAPDFRMWESSRTMPLVGGFSRESSVSSPFHSGADNKMLKETRVVEIPPRIFSAQFLKSRREILQQLRTTSASREPRTAKFRTKRLGALEEGVAGFITMGSSESGTRSGIPLLIVSLKPTRTLPVGNHCEDQPLLTPPGGKNRRKALSGESGTGELVKERRKNTARKDRPLEMENQWRRELNSLRKSRALRTFGDPTREWLFTLSLSKSRSSSLNGGLSSDDGLVSWSSGRASGGGRQDGAQSPHRSELIYSVLNSRLIPRNGSDMIVGGERRGMKVRRAITQEARILFRKESRRGCYKPFYVSHADDLQRIEFLHLPEEFSSVLLPEPTTIEAHRASELEFMRVGSLGDCATLSDRRRARKITSGAGKDQREENLRQRASKQ
ncbi:hypothetical protein PR048_032271 [Dryococelus australis]|uniref:Uncharacterized protein n=1 Tax=Dryococelus australis TaxID=614101 RepID=A0ABQ9G4Y4_9NEOP|nr:hypothetical protein PR048_032271 [Dryococelus australis]